MAAKAITLSVGDVCTSALWTKPSNAIATLVLAHGAGASMTHRSMEAIAKGLAARGIATLRYNFLYMERGSKRPDNPAVAQAVVRSAVSAAKKLSAQLPLFAGGKSYGGRMTSQAQAAEPLEYVRGLIFFGFPLHPAGAPAVSRAEHLAAIKIPMLFLQGTRDALAELDLLEQVQKRLGKRATLALADGADHSFHVSAKSGRSDDAVLADLLDFARAWIVRGAQ